MTPTITVFEQSPDGGRGLARDLRVRWALEEVGQAYAVERVSFAGLQEPEHRARNPFGQIPTDREGDLVLFGSGAIVLHIAHPRPGLLPPEPNARARAIMWMFAAIDTIEPPVWDIAMAQLFERAQPWYADRQALLAERAHTRLTDLAANLGTADWLDGAFSAGDLMMITVLKRAGMAGLLVEHPVLGACVSRGEARPAFQYAFNAI